MSMQVRLEKRVKVESSFANPLTLDKPLEFFAHVLYLGSGDKNVCLIGLSLRLKWSIRNCLTQWLKIGNPHLYGTYNNQRGAGKIMIQPPIQVLLLLLLI